LAKIVAVYSMKGGVGKTTIAANLAYASATNASLKTLLWDIDAQGAASFLLGQESPDGKAKRLFSREVEPSALITPTRWSGLDLLAADISLRHLDQTLSEADKPRRLRKLIQKLSPFYDRILLDCPPGLGEISDQMFRAVDLIVVPVPPSPLAMRSLTLIEEHLERHHTRKPQLFPVLSMLDRRKTMHRAFVAAHPDWPIIPQASMVERMTLERAPLASYAARSPAASAFAALWQQVEGALNAARGPDTEPDMAPKPSRALARIPSAAKRKSGKHN
jgi:chromosome partitioning protein